MRTCLLLLLALGCGGELAAAAPVFRAGAFAIDVTPVELPVIVNGGMTERTADKVHDRLHARCIVLDDGGDAGPIALVVVDNCMMPRSLLDDAKKRIADSTGISPARIMISATHTHSAPSVVGCLGSDVDEKYAAFLPGQIAKGVQLAHKQLTPARIGWAVGRDEKNVACRRWKMKDGVAPSNPFTGKTNDRAMMHPGFDNPNKIEATGPVDPEIPVIVLTTPAGAPIAWLSAYSLHYVGTPTLSADYFALVCENIGKKLASDKSPHPFVAAHANATSGDAWLMDYSQPARREFTAPGVAEEVAAAALAAQAKITYFDWAPIVMEERLLEVPVRMPTAEEVETAREFAKAFEGRKPKNVPEVYARETILLSEMPATRELKLQAIRIGDLGIATIPNEVFGSTGLGIKRESPLKTTCVIELANGCEGYIPPPEMHALGGYETWRARTSCLEEQAEPKIRAAAIELLKKVDGLRRDAAPVTAK